jgi:hypothetical protein
MATVGELEAKSLQNPLDLENQFTSMDVLLFGLSI